MNALVQILLWCPRCWRAIGGITFIFCSAFALLGLRLASRVDRIERKMGMPVELDKALASTPLPIPTSAEGIALAAFGAILGAALALAGKWAQKPY